MSLTKEKLPVRGKVRAELEAWVGAHHQAAVESMNTDTVAGSCHTACWVEIKMSGGHLGMTI